MTPPTDGWTIEKLASVTCLCENQLSYPLTFGDFDKQFSYGNDGIINTEYNHISTSFLYNDSYLGTVLFEECNKYEHIADDTPISVIAVFSSMCKVEERVPIMVNGIELGDSKEEVIMSMGDNYYANDKNFCIYYDKNNEEEICKFHFNSEDILLSIILSF